jgi:hypothetical protein
LELTSLRLTCQSPPNARLANKRKRPLLLLILLAVLILLVVLLQILQLELLRINQRQ